MTLRVMMVCLGNICRSPMAAAVLHNKARTAELDVVVASSGTASWHVGEGPNHMSKIVWSDAGYNYEHTASQFKSHMFDEYDYVLVMDESNFQNVVSLARQPEDIAKIKFLRSFDPDLTHISVESDDIAQLVVPDPWEKPREEFEEVLEMIERSVDGFLMQVSSKNR